MQPKVYFVSGVSGVGKSSTMQYLKRLLPQDRFDIRDFDERGVPDGGGPEWHKRETLTWLHISAENAKEGKSTIICGFNEPERVRAVHSADHPEAELILLHAESETVKKRLLGRYPTKESEKEIERAAGMPLVQFAENSSSYAPKLREIFQMENCAIVETDGKTPEAVAAEVARIILQ